MKLFDLIKIFNLKNISIFSVLLIMLSIVPSCALAAEEITQPPSPEGNFSTMQSRMTESVDRMIETLGNSTEDLDADTLASAKEMISELTAIKEEISNAETTSDLQTVREKLDTLIKAAPEELKSISGFGMDSGPGQAQNGSQIPPQNGSQLPPQNGSQLPPQNGSQLPPQGSGNMSEGRTEMPEGANVMSENASMEKQGMHGQVSDEQKKADTAKGNDTETSTEPGFFGKLINILKSLFS
ncbi:hypothetical protein MSLAZ_1487 [Methanosarcina lacustris Z-7289]|uniref:Uncharacterized protein n=1 Tax=Methanosarcina lacustris Z-7289 TaxID=1434111 RepID=A0A0E3S6W7_9EURY|nr:hypothetical protein [Methanosarcina lacustris]AKB74748.1 hypothetical protein MSLAZ_1487 [Methanosarcina lacustris Z-7289]